MQGFLLPLGIALNTVSALLQSRCWNLQSSSALPLALAAAPHIFSQVEGLMVSNLGRNVKSVFLELAVLELFSKQGGGLLARNTASFLS